MRRQLRGVVCAAVLALAGGAARVEGQAQAAAQPSPIEVLAQQFGGLSTDAERAALFERHPELAQPAAATALGALASGLSRARRFEASWTAYESLRWLGERTKNERVVGVAYGGFGSIDGRRGDLKRSVEWSERSLTIARNLKDQLLVTQMANNLSIAYRRLGHLDVAKSYAEEAIALAVSLKRPEQESRAQNNLGSVYSLRGQMAEALAAFSRSLDLKVDDGGTGSEEIANTLNNLGGLFAEMGDLDQALVYYDRAIATLSRLQPPRPELLAQPKSNRGNALIAQGRLAEARVTLEDALPLAQRSGSPILYSTVLFNLGNVNRDEGRIDAAIEAHQQALSVRETIGDADGQTQSLAELGRLDHARGRIPAAWQSLDRALAIATQAGLPSALARAQIYRGELFESEGRLTEALEAYEAAIEANEVLRSQALGGDQGRQIFLSWRMAPYLGAAAVHARLGRPVEAVLALERARARTLLDILAEGGPATRSLTPEERAQERALTAVVVSASEQVAIERSARPVNAARLADRQRHLAEARREREAFLANLDDTRPGFRLARGRAPLLTRDQLAGLVTPGTAIATFVLEPTRSWLYLIKGSSTGPDVQVHRLTIDPKSLTALATRFAGEVSSRDLGFAASSRALYAALLGPHEAWLAGVRHLVLVPDGALWRVPFQALQSPTGQYLIERTAVSYAPSLSALVALRQRHVERGPMATRLLALGDPRVTGAAAPPRLPEAVREVRAIGGVYGPHRSTVLTGPDATEAALRTHGPAASIVHIATHGVLDDVAPMYSHVLLAGDGRLDARELVEADLSADLVVLSACQTARGKTGGGEGIIGLSWGLFAAGASTAVLSQWEVDSASTTALMIGFHRRLQAQPAADRSAAEALRHSARSLMNDARYRHPFYWAGFVAIGR